MRQSCKDVVTDKPLVSVITATFNSEAYLGETIKSVISQTYENIEYIIIDGCSTDSTLDIIRKYDDKIASWRSEPDQNMYDAINKGIALSNGDIIAVLNSDDKYYDPGTIEFVVEMFSKHPNIDGLYGDLIKLYREHTQYKRLFQVNYEKYLLSRKGTFIPHITLFIKRASLQNIGPYNTRYNYAADYDFILRCLKNAKLKYINSPLAFFRLHSKSITASGKIYQEKLSILKDHHIERYNRAYAFLTYTYLWAKYVLLNLLNIRRDIRTV